MYCLALFDSGNFAFYLKHAMQSNGYFSEVISTPCKISRQGCGFCLKFPMDKKDIVMNEAGKLNIIIREIYIFDAKKYKKIFPI